MHTEALVPALFESKVYRFETFQKGKLKAKRKVQKWLIVMVMIACVRLPSSMGMHAHTHLPTGRPC
jgi:hypothetical protein